MDLMERPSMRRLIRDVKRYAPLLALGIMAIVVLVSTAVVIGASPQAPDRDAGMTALASPSPRPSATPLTTPAPTSSITLVSATPTPVATPPTPAPSAEMDATPTSGTDPDPIDVEDPDYSDEVEPDPEVALVIGGADDSIGGVDGEVPFYIRTGDTVDEVLELQTYDVDLSDCSLTQSYEPDDPAGTARTVPLQPLPEQSISMKDGRHTFVATCLSGAGELTATVLAVVRDGKPEACRDFEFVRGEISVSSWEALSAGVVGTWKGCVTTPWTPMYEVTVTLREDGTYSATSTEVLDGTDMIAMYYGTDDDFATKLYTINDFQDSQLGVGQIDVVFGAEPGVRDDLRNVRLMGDQLEFELFHMAQYGPVTFQLYRQ
jgi:hypothetical protein